MCSNESLPTQLIWITAQGVQSTTNKSTPLTPPMIGLPVVSFTSSSGGMGSASSSSPYTLPNPTVNDVYSFNVSVSNVAGVYTETLSSVQVSPLNVDVSRVSKEGCLGLAIGTEWLNYVTMQPFCTKALLSYLLYNGKVFAYSPSQPEKLCRSIGHIMCTRRIEPYLTISALWRLCR